MGILNAGLSYWQTETDDKPLIKVTIGDLLDRRASEMPTKAAIVYSCYPVLGETFDVYLETGPWWTELYERALADPNVGADKVLWGTDWGASIPFHSQPGRYPPSCAVQLRKQGPVNHQVDFWGWSMREMARLRIPQDDLNLILGVMLSGCSICL